MSHGKVTTNLQLSKYLRGPLYGSKIIDIMKQSWPLKTGEGVYMK